MKTEFHKQARATARKYGITLKDARLIVHKRWKRHRQALQ